MMREQVDGHGVFLWQNSECTADSEGFWCSPRLILVLTSDRDCTGEVKHRASVQRQIEGGNRKCSTGFKWCQGYEPEDLDV
jgi:hypothetical protein